MISRVEISEELTKIPEVPPPPNPDTDVGQNELAVYLPALYGAYAVCSDNMSKIERIRIQKEPIWNFLQLR